MPGHRLHRRTLLQAAGVAIGLPLLDAMLPTGARAEQQAAVLSPQRLLLIGRPLGFHAPYFFPAQTGRDYLPSRYLRPLAPHQADFTVFSSLSHRGYPGGHGTSVALLTGVGPEGLRPGDVRNTISLDQFAAQSLGGETRFSALVLGHGNDMSWNAKGVRLPAEERATAVFKQLFVQGTPAETARALGRIRAGQSILDGVRDQAQALSRQLGGGDRQRLDLLLSAIREAEARLAQDSAWVHRPKPPVAAQPFIDDYLTGQRMLERSRQWCDLVRLALATDSTRIISLHLWSHEAVTVDGVVLAHHEASHHGQDAAKIAQLATIEEAEAACFARLLDQLKETREGERTLLDRSLVFYGSNLGNASAHTCDNLPIIVAGGGLKHAGHVAYDRQHNQPLSNLFVRMLQQLGLEVDRFGSSTGVLGEV